MLTSYVWLGRWEHVSIQLACYWLPLHHASEHLYVNKGGYICDLEASVKDQEIDPDWEVKGQGCRMWTDCKAHRGKFVICDIGLYNNKINWIESSISEFKGNYFTVSSTSF